MFPRGRGATVATPTGPGIAGLDDGQGRLRPADPRVLPLGDRLERLPHGPGALLAGERIVRSAPQRRVDRPDGMPPAFGRERRQGEVAVGAVVADARLVPGPRVRLLRHAE